MSNFADARKTYSRGLQTWLIVRTRRAVTSYITILKLILKKVESMSHVDKPLHPQSLYFTILATA